MLQSGLLLATVALAMASPSCSTEDHVKSSFVESRMMSEESSCAAAALTAAGWVCGAQRASRAGAPYASFRGVPYARQPLGALRFKTLEPVEPWTGYFNATEEGPVCPQRDIFYKTMMQPQSMSEDCIHANIHVPAEALPAPGAACAGSCRPVLVFIHGGAFTSGSGDADFNGPEFLIDHGIILITFNYRVGPFGFLSLNSSTVPGNAGLRDMVTLLQWVQNNVRSFGGDPDDVTLMGLSAGSVSVHMLSLSHAADGLFKRMITLSGVASSGYVSTTPAYARDTNSIFLKYLGINSTDADEIHSDLLSLSAQEIVDATTHVQDTLGLATFVPVVESAFPGVTAVLDDDPDVLLAAGRGKDYPLLIGYTDLECVSLTKRLQEINILGSIESNPLAILPTKMSYVLSNTSALTAAEKMQDMYFNGTATLDKFITACSDSYFIYPALKLAQYRANTPDSAPAYLQQFSYNSAESVLKEAYGTNYTGAGHFEDATYVLRVNSILGNRELTTSDNSMKDWMTTTVVNFMRCSSPTCADADAEAARGRWPALRGALRYQDVSAPRYAMRALSQQQRDMMDLFDTLYAM